jgi:hypothetical protein
MSLPTPDDDDFPPVKHPWREALTMILAAALVAYLAWCLIRWLF